MVALPAVELSVNVKVPPVATKIDALPAVEESKKTAALASPARPRSIAAWLAVELLVNHTSPKRSGLINALPALELSAKTRTDSFGIIVAWPAVALSKKNILV